MSPIPFQGFDDRGAVRIYAGGALPHWRQDGCTYFVTFRLADSIPVPKLQELEHDRRCWLRSHGIEPETPNWERAFAALPDGVRRQYQRQIGATLDKFLDAGYGECILRQVDAAKVVADALLYFHGTRVLTGDLVVMPNHCHVLLRPLPGVELEDVLHSVKSFSGNQLNQQLGRDGALWQKESYDHIVRDFEQLEAYQRYIATNPVSAGLNEGEFLLAAAQFVPGE